MPMRVEEPDTSQGRQPEGHEIYLGDPRRTAPEMLRAVMREPVARKDETVER